MAADLIPDSILNQTIRKTAFTRRGAGELHNP